MRRFRTDGSKVIGERHSGYTPIWGEFLRSPRQIGAIAPSSRALAEQMIAPIPKRGNPVVVELGPGTGAFTTAIQQRLGGRGTHLAVELNPRFASTLRRDYPHVEVICGNATELPAMLAARGLVADVVISGLPWTAYPVTVPSLPAIIAAGLRPDGAFTQFTYTWGRWAPPARRQQRWLREAFEEVVLSRTVWGNLPPALVYLSRRPQTTDSVVGDGRGGSESGETEAGN